MTIYFSGTTVANSSIILMYTSEKPYVSTTSGVYVIGCNKPYTSTSYRCWINGNSNGTWTKQHENQNNTGTGFNRFTYDSDCTSVSLLQKRVIEVDYNLQYNNQIVAQPPESYNVYPYIMNTADDLAKGNQDIIIMPGDFPNTKEIRFGLQVMTETDDGNGNITESWNNVFSPISLTQNSEYYEAVDETGVGFYYVIPWTLLKQNLQLSKHYCYVLAYEVQGQTIRDEIYATYGGLTPEDALKNSLDEQTTLINQQLLQIQQMNENIENMFNYQQATTDAVDNLNDTITDDTISSGASDLPSINVSDPTQNGIDNIFQSIYNAFCTGQAQDIVFPIPFTDKNITLSPYYVRDMLNSYGASWIYLLIQAFWGYLIGRYIVKDISHKITKIKSGDIENIENNNIKEEML